MKNEGGGALSFPSAAFLWPALVATWARDATLVISDELTRIALGDVSRPRPSKPRWATRNRIALELDSMQLRDFSTDAGGTPTLVCPPFALHDATIADFARGHSLVATLRSAGLTRLFVTHWRSATPEMRFMSIDSYLAEINVAVDELGGSVNLIGLCQGGWMALAYAARFPAKVRKLVLAGAPVDISAGESPLSRLAAAVPLWIFEELVRLGNGRILGQQVLEAWPGAPDAGPVRQLSGISDRPASPSCERTREAFNRWYAWTVDLPGTYYLQVVDWLYKQNRLATGRFVALGHRVDLSMMRNPIFLLAARDDELVACEQLFATERLVGTPREEIRKAIAPCAHLGLFLSGPTLRDHWPTITRWLLGADAGQAR